MTLHPQLAKDSVPICRFELCELRLINDDRFAWLILFPLREGISEWFELSEPEQLQLHQETMHVAKILKARSHCQKINIGAIGNVVRQLHVHVIARNENDACWPRPVWGTALEPMSDNALNLRVAQLQAWFAPAAASTEGLA